MTKDDFARVMKEIAKSMDVALPIAPPVGIAARVPKRAQRAPIVFFGSILVIFGLVDLEFWGQGLWSKVLSPHIHQVVGPGDFHVFGALRGAGLGTRK